MYKSYLILIVTLSLGISTAIASPKIDSIGVENYKGKKLILHQIEAKETYYAIGKRYNVNYKDIILFNDNKALHVGVIVKVPTAIDFTTVPVSTASTAGLMEYTIKAKDNLNMLAEKYGTTVNEIKRVNNLSSINLQIGQVLKIPTNGSSPAASVTEVPSGKTVVDQKTVISTDGKSIEHTVKPKENLNLLAEKYSTTVDEIKRFNGLSSNNLSIGQVLKIPASTVATNQPAVNNPVINNPIVNTTVQKSVSKVEAPVNTASNNVTGSFEHVVMEGETIYSIAKKYNLTTYQLKTSNNLTADAVSVGQKLMIKTPRSVAAVNNEEEGEPGENTIKDPSLRSSPSNYGIVQVEEKGVAVWIADADLDASKMLVLHRTAPVGTIIKVTNPMSNRSAFAKVVGKYTENETTKDVIIVMTKAVADAVGALDKRFSCNLTYGAQANEQQ